MLYCGPFFRCIVSKVETQTEYRGCGTPDCPNANTDWSSRPRAKFCSHCGRPFQQLSKMIAVAVVNGSELACERMKERLAFYHDRQTNQHVFLPNILKGRPREFDMEDAPEGVHELDATVIIHEEAWLLDAYSDEYGVLIQAYGREHVCTVWGLFVDC